MDPLLQAHALSSLLHILHLFTLFLSISIEAYIFTHKLNPAYHLLPSLLILILPTLKRLLSTPNPIYLVDFSCLRPPPRLRVPTAAFIEHLPLIGSFDADSISFMSKVLTSSGLGEETYFPPSLHFIPPKSTHQDSSDEAKMLLFPVFDGLLAETHVSPRDIDILVVNCSGFCPSPSLSALVVNRYSLREDVKTFSVAGMGCGAGAIGVDIACGLLSVHPNYSYAVVLSTEAMSTGWYAGTDRRKLLLNCYFRTGSSAALLTNRREARKESGYRLVRLVRTQRAFEDRAYRSAIREEDSEGIAGFSIDRDLLRVAAETLRSNVVSLGTSILPAHEKFRYGLLYLWKALTRSSWKSNAVPVPDFRSAIQHYCLPASGKAVIEEIGKGLRLGERELEAALMTLHRFGNQSSSSMWYQLAYLEAKGRVKKGHKVWQLGMGSGPKCNTVVWQRLRPAAAAVEAEKGPWAGCIDRYPIRDRRE